MFLSVVLSNLNEMQRMLTYGICTVIPRLGCPNEGLPVVVLKNVRREQIERLVVDSLCPCIQDIETPPGSPPDISRSCLVRWKSVR